MIKHYFKNRLYSQLEKLHWGTLTLTTPDGITRQYSGADPSGTAVSMTVKDWSVIPNLLLKGDIGFAEDYRDNKWETDNLTALLTLALKNRAPFDKFVLGKTLFRAFENLKYLLTRNSLKGSRKNIEAHYDLGNEFYAQWLDPSMTYSSAVFSNEGQTLEAAQANKYDLILNQLDRKDGSLLEIGCGWGGFIKHAQANGNFDVKGLTLSPSQLSYAAQQTEGQANIELKDYRHEKKQYDSIVSIEMFEAVGEDYWPVYFKQISKLLNRGGRAVIQTITINEMDFERYRKGSDFIRTYIFPGGMLPSTRRFIQEAEKAGLIVSPPTHHGTHYAKTLNLWLKNFDAAEATLNKLGFDKPFTKLWRFYLAACSAGFATGRTDVIQANFRKQS
jgi:cyclopropane-fatty-acyl-phospholipid synthase